MQPNEKLGIIQGFYHSAWFNILKDDVFTLTVGFVWKSL